MLCIEEIKQMLSKINCSNVKYVSKSLITNGTLFNEKSVEFLIQENFDNIQVTLDGDKISHDKFRVFENGQGSYDVIGNNLINFSNRIPITLNVNLNKENSGSVKKLLDLLEQKSINVNLAFSIVFDTKKHRFSHTIRYNNTIWKDAHLIATKYGHSFLPFYRSINYVCGLYKENEYVISPDGNLYKCVCAIGNDTYKIGKIGDYGTNRYYTKLSQFIEPEPIKQSCLNCPFIINCGINCRYIHDEKEHVCYKNDILYNDIELIKLTFGVKNV